MSTKHIIEIGECGFDVKNAATDEVVFAGLSDFESACEVHEMLQGEQENQLWA